MLLLRRTKWSRPFLEYCYINHNEMKSFEEMKRYEKHLNLKPKIFGLFLYQTIDYGQNDHIDNSKVNLSGNC